MPSPDPTCTLNGFSTPIDCAAGASVSGALASPAGAKYWSVSCVSTDDTSSVATVNASLVVNQTTKTFTFTATSSLASCAVFRSTVGIANLGLDINGVPNPAYSTTFKVNVLGSNGLRVLAINEFTEQSSPFGWIVEVNAAIRGAAGGSSVTGGMSLIRTTPALTTLDSTASIPANYAVVGGGVLITNPYNNGATYAVGQNGNPGLLIPAGTFDPTTAFPSGDTSLFYPFAALTLWGGTSLPVRATITGSPTQGSSVVLVQYGLVNS